MPQERPPKDRSVEAEKIGQDALTVDIKRLLENEGARPLTRNELIQDIGRHRADARTDGLTGLYNKAEFKNRLAGEVALAWRQHRPLAVLILDGDHFKRVNDTHGHPIGDETLRLLATVLKSAVRSSDVVCRWGGEEFAVILPDTTLDGAVKAAQKIRTAVEQTPFVFGEHDVDSTQPGGKFTVSVGATSYPPDQGVYETRAHGREEISGYQKEIADTLTATADAALYDAKKTRNMASARTYGSTGK